MYNHPKKILAFLFYVLWSDTSIEANAIQLETPQVRANGMFQFPLPTLNSKAQSTHSQASENGKFLCSFSFSDKGIVQSLSCLQKDQNPLTLKNVDANAVGISNSGFLVLTHINWRTESPSQFSFYDWHGNFIGFRKVINPEHATFSESGNYFGISTKNHFEILDLKTNRSLFYRQGEKFSISENGSIVAIAHKSGISVYMQGSLIWEAQTGFQYLRDLKISPDGKSLAIADIHTLNVYEVQGGKLLFSDPLDSDETFRNLRFNSNGLWAGIKKEYGSTRMGILKSYSLIGPAISSIKTFHAAQTIKTSGYKINPLLKKQTGLDGYPSIPWPLSPQNQAHKVWNNYEGFNSSDDGVVTGDFPYLHQGIDMEVNANDPVYSVDTGIVKYHGDLGGAGALYWRIAISRQQISGYSNGWLYAHLIDTTINYTVGDRVRSVGLHLGNIIAWYGNISGHLHFNEIRDQGTTWSYTDDEWGITYNPLYSLTPLPDTSKPMIVQAIAGKSKFAYCPNNTSYTATASNYLFPDSARGGLKGDIDIIARIQDFVVFTNFTQPAHTIRYWIKSISPRNSTFNKLVVDTTLAAVRNHAYNFYSGPKFKAPAEVLYKADNVFVVGGWFNRTRTFAHILTNNNGDSLLTNGEKDSSLHTAKFLNGWYRIYVKAFDIVGNSVVDSENVYFNNPITSVQSETPNSLPWLSRKANTGSFQFFLPTASATTLHIINSTGQSIKTLTNGQYPKGIHTVNWDGTDFKGHPVSNGMYFIKFYSKDFSTAMKAIYWR